MTRPAGFSLLELLLVLATSSTFLFAIYQLFFHQQQQYVQQQLLLQSQENSRLALHILKNHIQMAGEAGCGSLANLKIHDHLQHNPRAIYEVDNQIYIEKASYERAHLAQVMNNAADPIYIQQEHVFEEGDIVFIADCEYADLFKIKQIKASAQGQMLYHDGLSRIYNTRAQVMRWQVDRFYVTPHQNNASQLDLYQKTIMPDKSAIELVEQLTQWHVQYAILQNQHVLFLDADHITDWTNVRGIMINDFNIVLYHAQS